MLPHIQQEPSPDCEQFFFIWKVCIGGTICVLGTVGNTLCIIMFHAFSQLGECLLLLLKALAWADFIHVILFLLVMVIPDLAYHCCGGHKIWDFTMYSYSYIWPFATITMICDTWLIVLISVHRYIAVCYPLQSSEFSTYSRLRKQVIIVVAVACIMEFPRFFEYNIFDEPVEGTNNTRKSLEDSEMSKNYYYQLIYKSIIMLSYKKYIPMVIISFSAVQIIRTVRRMSTDFPRSSITSRDKLKAGSNVTRMMLSIMIVFIVTKLPTCVYPIARIVLDDDQQGTCSIYKYYVTAVDILMLINPCVNFVIYVITWRSFRSTLMGCCCLLCRETIGEESRTDSAITRNGNINVATITTKL